MLARSLASVADPLTETLSLITFLIWIVPHIVIVEEETGKPEEGREEQRLRRFAESLRVR